MLSETRVIADAKLQSVFGSLKVIISSNSNTKLVNISIDYVGRSSSHLIILTYNLHIQRNRTCLLILHPRKSHQAAGAHRRLPHVHTLISCGRRLTSSIQCLSDANGCAN